MHDCKGRLIEKGDVLKVKHYDQMAERVSERPGVAKVLRCYPGSDTCNVYAAALLVAQDEYGHQFSRTAELTFTAKDTEVLMKADGSAPVEPAHEPAPSPA